MDETTEIIVVVLVFMGIVIVTSVVFYFRVRQTAAGEHDQSPVSLEGRIKPVLLKTNVEIINDVLIIYKSQRLNIITQNFKQRLGEGGYGAVYKGVLDDGVPVAVKVLKCSLSDQTIRQQFKAEVNSIRRTRHPNLVRLYGFCFDEGLKALVYEFMENGSLSKLLFDGERKNSVTFRQLLNIAIGTAEGIAYLHEKCPQQIIHYDIKPENILLDGNFSPKVSDFGLAKLCGRDETDQYPGFRGTPGYAAPEMWQPVAVTHKCDVYSFGMLLFEILGRRRNLDLGLTSSQEWLPRYAWKKFDEGATDELMVTLQIDEKDRDVATKMVMVALWCIQRQPQLRPMMSCVVKMLEGTVGIERPACPFPNPTSPVCLNPRNLGDNTSSASSSSTIWITPSSREESTFLR